MSEAELDRIMDDVLDGVATSEQAAWLDKKLAGDPQARSRFERRKELFGLLGRGHAMVEAPADLAPAVMREIRAGSRPAKARPGLPSWLHETFGRRRGIGWAYAVGAAAALVALAVMTRMDRNALGSKGWLPVTGTMAPAGPGESGAPVNQARIEAGSSHAGIELFRQGEVLLVRIETHSTKPLGVELEYDPAAVSAALFDGPHGLEFRQASPGVIQYSPSGDVMARVRLTPLAKSDTQVRVTLESEGVISRAVLHTGSAAAPRR
jgi:hypothetical protein